MYKTPTKFKFAMWQIICLGLVYINYSAAKCNVCQANQAACINSTSFYLCFGDKEPNRNMLYHCKDGFDCTDLKAICVQTSSQRPPSCGDTSLCGMCSAHRNYLFACLSRTTFQMCYGAVRPVEQIGSCPSGYICDRKSDAVCVLEGTVDSITCDILDNNGMISSSSSSSSTSSTSTTITPTTADPDSGMLTPTEMCEQHRRVGLYPTTPNDPFCKRYISCYFSNGILRGREYNCPLGTYFHIQQVACVFNKPTYCI